MESYYTEFVITCCGNAGHGSIMHDNTAGEKIRYVVDKFMDYREVQKRRLLSDPNLMVGDVTSVNLTLLEVNIYLEI